MSLWLMIIILFVAGFAAGFLASVAGLASLISYPVLLALGVPPVSANTTNTAALMFTGVGAYISSSNELRSDRKTTWKVAIVALVGGVIGAIILAVSPASSFEKIVPFLIFGAGLLMLWNQYHQPSSKKHNESTLVTVLKYIAIFLVGVYIGYFGASAGLILLSILMTTLNKSYAVTNAIKNFTTFLTNVLSVVVYAFTTKVYWWMVVPMGAGMFLGGYVGPIVVRNVPVRPLKFIVAYAAFGLAIYLFWTTYF